MTNELVFFEAMQKNNDGSKININMFSILAKWINYMCITDTSKRHLADQWSALTMAVMGASIDL